MANCTQKSTYSVGRWSDVTSGSGAESSYETHSRIVDLREPAITLVQEWLSSATNDCRLLEPSANRAQVLVDAQVTTRSTIGAIAYESGGVLIDHGWLRFLGSGHSSLTRTLSDWNRNKAKGCYFIADDAAGGFFAINGGSFGPDVNNIYYWPPDSFEWEAMKLGYTDFFRWALIGDLEKFYSNTRWSTWQQDVAALSSDHCFTYYPPLWTKEGSSETSYQGIATAEEAFLVKTDILDQLSIS